MKHLIFAWIALLALAGCNSSSDQPSNTYVAGSWVASCVIRHAAVGIETITFSSQMMSSSTVVYYDGTCPAENGETSTTESETNYLLGGQLITDSGNTAYEIDIDVYRDDEFFYTEKNIVSIINGTLYFGDAVSFSECDPEELVYLGPGVRDLCNQRPTKLNFEEPYNRK